MIEIKYDFDSIIRLSHSFCYLFSLLFFFFYSFFSILHNGHRHVYDNFYINALTLLSSKEKNLYIPSLLLTKRTAYVVFFKDVNEGDSCHFKDNKDFFKKITVDCYDKNKNKIKMDESDFSIKDSYNEQVLFKIKLKRNLLFPRIRHIKIKSRENIYSSFICVVVR